jgi:hypothetical protein
LLGDRANLMAFLRGLVADLSQQVRKHARFA